MSDLEIHPFTPDDADAVAAALDVRRAVSSADAPWAHPALRDAFDGLLRHGWDGEPPAPYLTTEAGRPVGYGSLEVTERDNRHLAWLGVEIHPDHRRRGHGSLLLERLVADAEALGRTVVGLDGWESPATSGFAARHGFEPRSREVNRRQHLADVDRAAVRAAHDDAARAAGDYELVRVVGRTPPEMLDAVAELAASINDAPTDDLDIEDEVMSGERLRAYEDAMEASGERLYRLVARHRPTGELAGHSVVAVETQRPTVAHQHDTAVARTHRGHRLGLLLKAGMLLWLAEAEPQVETVDTWNAESNDHMIGVNEELGYRVLGRTLLFQRPV